MKWDLFWLIGSVIVVTLMTVFSYLRRHDVERAKARGLWPEPGRIPTVDDVRRLAQAGEKILAIRLYRRIDQVSLAEAKQAVEALSR
ncbi:MAG: hypothetical protein JWM68_4395 [Verrucomicrobiales bacterium]|nr:hypothetical protein [Verrucomicrobiales bacterium]